jgi:hypothetical protein
MPLPTPSPPVLFGTSAAQIDASRTSDALRFDWTDVAGATTYDIRFGAADERTNVAKGSFLGGLPPNQIQIVRLRAVDGADVSAWSSAVSFATRPERPSAPFLQSAANRGEDSLVFDWNIVNGIPDYELLVNSVMWPALVQPPFSLTSLPGGGPLLPNTKYDISVRARDDAGGGISEWSDVATFVTRPPRPDAPTRVHADLLGWGIVMRWEVSDAFNNGTNSFVRLFRDTGGVFGEKLLDGESSPGGRRTSRYVDIRQRMSIEKTYRLQAVIPAGAAPAPIPAAHGGPENQSFESPPLIAKFPYCITAQHPPRPFPAGVERFRIGIGGTTR